MRETLYPQDWQKCLLGTVCDIQIGGTPSRNEPRFWATSSGGHMWVAISDLGPRWIKATEEHITDFGVRCSNVKRVPKGTLLMSFKLTIGRIGFAGNELYTNEAIAAFYPKQKGMWIPWLYHALPSIIETNVAAEQAVKGQTLNKEKLQNFILHCPGYEEQRRIAEILDTIDAQIQLTEQLITKLKLQKTGLLRNLLTCGLDELGQLRDPIAHPKEFQESELGRIPRKWEIYHLGKIAEIGAGLTLGKKLSGPGTLELPYLRVANVQDGYLDLADIKTIRLLEEDIPKYLLQPGDVLMTEGGDFDKLGRGTIWQGQIPICLHQNHIFRVRTDRRYLCPEFLTLISSSSYGKRFFVLCSKQSTNLASINSTQLKAFPIPCPPINEQKRILSVLHDIERNIHIEEMHLNKLKLNKKGVLQDLLTGNVRVNAEKKTFSEERCPR